ncbi:MAG: DUF4105 domain-containing protein [Thiogranum sp.]|nr:DUF4105 domain-containing protein [Thiogranum sp.]
MMRFALVLVFVLVVAAPGAASGADATSLREIVRQKQLWTARYWRVLGHYRPDRLGAGYTSEIDDPAFFLAADGKGNPAAELQATLDAMLSPLPEGDRHAQCRFPARYQWLREQLDLDRLVAARDCPEYGTWRTTINAGSVTLVFPAAYMNAPSSMFGHTLLRIDPADSRKDTPLTSYALNYAANALPDMNGLVYSYKGLFGGFPGEFSIVPYYEKIAQYNDMESRDVWEYTLNLTPAEIDRLMAHTWELRDMQSDYFFFDENCSYMLLTVLEAARDDVSLLEAFAVKAIPADTVRAVHDQGMIADRRFRASSASRLMSQLGQMTQADRAQVLRLGDVNAPAADIESQHTPLQRARIYETTYDYLRYLASRDGERVPQRVRRSYEMLAARSRLALDSEWQPLPTPRVAPEEGHGTSRIGIGAGRAFDDGYLSFQYRPAFHDLVDDPAGFAPGSQINFFALDARYFPDGRNLELASFRLIDIVSLSPRDAFFRPWSWQTETGVLNIGRPDDRMYAWNGSASGGVSYRPGRGITVSALAGGVLDVSGELERDYRVGPSVEMIGLLRFRGGSSKLSIKAVEYFPDTPDEYRLQYEQAHYLDRDHAIRFGFTHHRRFRQSDRDIRINLHRYF